MHIRCITTTRIIIRNIIIDLMVNATLLRVIVLCGRGNIKLCKLQHKTSNDTPSTVVNTILTREHAAYVLPHHIRDAIMQHLVMALMAQHQQAANTHQTPGGSAGAAHYCAIGPGAAIALAGVPMLARLRLAMVRLA